MNDEAVYRTAPATPGLLKSLSAGNISYFHLRDLHTFYLPHDLTPTEKLELLQKYISYDFSLLMDCLVQKIYKYMEKQNLCSI